MKMPVFILLLIVLFGGCATSSYNIHGEANEKYEESFHRPSIVDSTRNSDSMSTKVSAPCGRDGRLGTIYCELSNCASCKIQEGRIEGRCFNIDSDYSVRRIVEEILNESLGRQVSLDELEARAILERQFYTDGEVQVFFEIEEGLINIF